MTQEATSTDVARREEHEPSSWRPLLELVFHLFLGSLLFTVIAALAVALTITAKELLAYGLADNDAVLVTALTWLKYFLLAMDAALFVIYVGRSFIDTSKKLWTRKRQ